MARCPFALWRPIDSHGGPMRADLGAIEHVTTNHGDPENFFANAANKASSHFWIADDGTLEQYVDTDFASWAQAGGNYQYVSVETSGTPDQTLTEAQVITFARLYAWGHATHGWPFQLADRPGQSGLGWHGMGGAAWGGHTGCPGDLRKAQRARIVALAQGTPPTPPSPPGPTTTDYPGASMRSIDFHQVRLDGQGKGWVDVDAAAHQIEDVVFNGQDPVSNHGYDTPPTWDREDIAGHGRIQIIGGPPGGLVDFTVWVVE